MKKSDRKCLVDNALDEIDACCEILESKSSPEAKKRARGWIRKQKDFLKELKYRGKIRRLKKGA